MDNDLIKKWYGEIDRGIKWKEKISSYKKWKKYRQWYRNDFAGEKPGKKQGFAKNIFLSTVKTIVNATYYQNPKVVVTPYIPGQYRESRILEALLNQLISSTRLKKTIKRAVREACITGLGCVQIGYDEYLDYDKEGKPLDYKPLPMDGVWVDYIPTSNVVVPAEIAKPENFQWVAYFDRRNLEDVQENPRFLKKARKELKGSNMPLSQDVSESIFSYDTSGSKERTCYLMKVHDLKSGKVYIFSENQLLYEEEDRLQDKGKLPFEFIQLVEDSEHFWGISVGQVIENLQEEINETKAILRALRKSNILKFLYLKGALQDKDLNDMLSRDVQDIGIGVGISPEHVDSIAQAVQLFQVNPNTINLLRETQGLEQDTKDVMSLGTNQSGQYSGKHNVSAREAGFVNRYNELGIEDYKDTVADAIEGILSRYATYVFKYWTLQRSIKVALADQDIVEKFTGSDLLGEYAIKVEVADYQPNSDEQRKNEMMQISQMMLQDPVLNADMNRAVMFRKYLLEAFGWKHPDIAALFQTPQLPPELMAMMAQMQQEGQELDKQPVREADNAIPVQM
jgi:hypothetical protein